ncbi:MAG: transcriptional repressor LexA [Clostridia bacterium]|nr:transcriptional repressor LexA [Clostridia bacterium]
MKNENLNEKLDLIYNFTVNYVEDNGFPPSVREICAKCNIKSTATAYSYINKLKKKGLLSQSPSKKRALIVNSLKKDYTSIPLIGTITAGTPIFAVENLDGYIPLPSEFNDSEDKFALKVRGDSMINAGICNNDVIIVQKTESAKNGDIVVALVDDSATVKRFFKHEDKICLHPENDNMEDMLFDNVVILGLVKGLIRKF